MGLFDRLKSIGKKIQSEMNQKSTTSYNAPTKPVEVKEKITVPEEYKAFPIFEGKCIRKDNMKQSKYIRYTMDYVNVSNDDLENYLSTVSFNGFVKATKVRYEKSNTYMIIEPKGSNLHLVFHIKK